MRIPLLSALLFLSTLATAQTTWLVDAAGGPGAHFTAIQAAVDAAADGDRILVRAGLYTGFVIDGKGLAVLGEPGVDVGRGLVRVLNTAPGQDVVLADLGRFVGQALFGRTVTNCAGRVLFERMTGENISCLAADDLRFNGCQLTGFVQVDRCRATLSDCRLFAGPFFVTPPPALRITDSTVTVARCDVAGQVQLGRAGASSAISVMAPSLLTLTDDGSHTIGAGVASGGGLAAIVGTGTVVRDPRVQVLGSGGAPGLAVGADLVRHVPALQALGAPVGATIEVDLAGLPGELFVLVFGLPGQPLSLPGIRGELGLWLPLATEQGVFGPLAVHRSIVAAPGLPPGIQLCWQALVTDGRGGFALSNHATYTRTR